MNRVIYVSRGGNTKKIAGAVAKGAGVSAAPIEEFDTLQSSDILFVGASIYAGSIDGKLRKLLKGLQPSQVKSVAVFGTSAGNKSARQEIKSILEPKGITVLNEEFHCRGSFLFANRGRPNEEDMRQAEDFAKRVCNDGNE